MSRKTDNSNSITAKLSQPGPALNTQRADRLPAPTTEQSMSLTLDQLRPYDRNPRTHQNPKYDEIKESIRAIGLRQKLTVTQRPGDDRYMISDGGNTRLTILNELYQETGDKRFYHQDCHFVPWQGEINVLTGHLAENDNRGQLSWVERSRGIVEAKRLIEEDAGETISQRELTKRLRTLGYTINHGHVSRMIYTVENFLPTIPLSLESGMGRPQVEKLISFRQFCEECWRRCESYWEEHADDFGEGEQWALSVVDGNFDQAWHDEMTELDYEGQTEFKWNVVEDRLKGMLHEHTGLHFNPIDMAWKNWFTVRKHSKSATEEERADIWTTVDSELERLRNPDQPDLYPPKEKETGSSLTSGAGVSKENKKLASPDSSAPEKVGTTSDSDTSGEGTEKKVETEQEESGSFSPSEQTQVSSTSETSEVLRMRQQLEELEARNAELEAQTQQTPVAPQGVNSNDSDDAIGLLDAEPTRTSAEQSTIVDDLTLSPYNESDGHRQLRHWQAKEHGEEAFDFEASALKSVPLQDGESIAPITDLWHIPTWRRNPQDLRLQIGQVVQTLASWAEIDASGTSDVIRLNAREGLGYELNPLNIESAPSRRAQLVWQLLAALEGNIDPMLPNDISLLGELVGSHDSSDHNVRLPDGLFVRVFWLTRLIRVLRSELENTEGDA
ncbi:ParB family protein [Kushneria indalinina]|uniref:ParB family protein of integrating conjugative element (PFGI_1 class) n=1 Tax=Kushneria indalinina DSM 14324 TaxID=1122140 RepID=A0A3D9DRM0_9GAMM|nr:ParB family protein [Kushneria indalinina]REC93403.1 ParB family protein of integrating conjugative element (PFGI_1 class) [Kushneria indalinina DSM 14324]